MIRVCNPDASTPRRGLGGVCLLMLVALTLSAGMAGAEWARLPVGERDSAQASRASGTASHTAHRTERRQTIKPALGVLFSTNAVTADAVRLVIEFWFDGVPSPRRLRAGLLNLPPPACA